MTDSTNLYVRLFHGRDAPDQDMNDWGFDGPLIGPIGIHWVYGNLQLHGPGWHSFEFLPVTKDELVQYDGKFYGDFEIFVEGDPCIEKNRENGIPIHDYAKFASIVRPKENQPDPV